jgi:BirA family biotin operon repressor/biotin-[acetyl-CoA-carboxylase] ligase
MEIAAPMPVGSVVVADEQTAGIGRHGHSWNSEKDTGLYVSMVLEPHPVLTLALGLAAQEGLRKVTSLECDIRWPNDLMLSGRKLGGILVQLHEGRAVAGIGINIGQRRFPDDLATIATSLFIETGLEFRRDDLLDALLESVTSRPQERVIEQWQARSTWACGKAVQVEGGITGVTAGLTESGYLLVRTAQGRLETIVAGGVREL